MSLANQVTDDRGRWRDDWGHGFVLVYGSYRHALGEATVAIERRTQFSAAGVARFVRQQWKIEGRLTADTPAELTAALAAMETAYRKPNQNATLYLADGVTPTAHQLVASQTLDGVRVVRPPSFPQGRDTEYVTSRTYAIELEADTPCDGNDTVLESSESLTFTGGGPRWVYLPTLVGPPIRQQLQQRTPYRAVQSGRTVGLLAYPSPANPIWPQAWHQDQAQVIRQLLKPHEYEVQWTYHFEWAERLVR